MPTSGIWASTRAGTAARATTRSPSSLRPPPCTRSITPLDVGVAPNAHGVLRVVLRVSYVSCVPCVRLFPQFGRKHAVQLLDYAIDLSEQTKDGKQEKRPILFHVFSNNGLYFYANVLQQVARSSQVSYSSPRSCDRTTHGTRHTHTPHIHSHRT